MIDWPRIQVLTFDCYGTLIDWEAGILAALVPILTSHQVKLPDQEVLEMYGELEGEAEREPFRDYKSVLRTVMRGFEQRLGIQLTDREREALVESIRGWQSFPDTVMALRTLKRRFKLAVISNTDDDIFSFTEQHLGVRFDWIITAERVKSYKPSINNFRTGFNTIGVTTDRVVHVAQSLFHDIAPAKQLGVKTVWVNRRGHQQGSGATLPGNAEPDMVVPDLRTLAEIVDSQATPKW